LKTSQLNLEVQFDHASVPNISHITKKTQKPFKSHPKPNRNRKKYVHTT
jgi:hypothetical protein